MVMEYDHSRWNPYGIKVEWNQENEWDPSQNIFHMEWMESTWNYMESTWNPHGIHMEYGGRVKTLYYHCNSPSLIVVPTIFGWALVRGSFCS